jgi:CRISPR-associated protein Csm2
MGRIINQKGGEKMNNERKINPISINNDILKKIIVEGDVKELNKYADELAQKFITKLEIEEQSRSGNRRRKEKELTTSQIRNIFDVIQRMTKYDENKLQLLRPKLAYLAGKHGGRVKEFQTLIEKCLPLVTDDTTFTNFKNFIEAIVAYHKFHGGAD